MNTKKQRAFQPEEFEKELGQTRETTETPVMGRKSKKKTEVGITVRFPEAVYEGLRAYSYHERAKMNPLIVEITRRFLTEKGYITIK